MKIIEQGLTWWEGARLKCGVCATEFQLDATDDRFRGPEWEQGDDGVWSLPVFVECPHCLYPVRLEQPQVGDSQEIVRAVVRRFAPADPA